MDSSYDLIIIGAGFAGLTAALYARRANLKTLVLDPAGFGGQIVNADLVENWPGVEQISGFELAQNLFNQVKNFGADFLHEAAEKISHPSNFTVKTAEKTYTAKSLIFATGSAPKSLNLPNEHFCATCDGAFFKDKTVAVIGGGNTALQDALYLSRLAEKVYLIHRRAKFRADQILQDRVAKTPNLEVRINPDVKAEISAVNPDGIFVAIGRTPNTALIQNLADLDDSGYALSTDTTTKTPGFFVAGDCRNGQLKQLITAAADGALAAGKAIDFVAQSML